MGDAFAGMRCCVERSPADGVMLPDNLGAIGADEVLAPCARRLAERGADVVAWACTSGSFARGRGRAHEQISMLEKAAGRPATSTSVALAEAALDLGSRDVDVLSAYNGPVSDLFVDFLEASGLSVHVVKELGCVHTEESFAVDIELAVARFAAETPGTRLLLVPDTAINTLGAVTTLQEIARRPVITANQATLWHALRLARGPVHDVTATFGAGSSAPP
jgi:maleate cis-trans isomerase